MLEGLEEQPPGRPSKQTDPQLEALQTKVRQLQAELEMAKQTAAVRGILAAAAPARSTVALATPSHDASLAAAFDSSERPPAAPRAINTTPSGGSL
jgi:hypothetical protein